ncbi:MAG: cbr1, partial [Solirubrobacterales bacterium]|nr:cbr1 [Solirubrobacterales bacterium]
MNKVAVVTGANQGLGFALAEGLAQQLAPEDVVYLTGRDPDRVRAAAAGIAG